MPLTPKERKAALVLHSRSVAQIARELGVTGPHVSQVLHGVRRSPRVEAAIAEAIGQPVAEVFPPDARRADLAEAS